MFLGATKAVTYNGNYLLNFGIYYDPKTFVDIESILCAA